MEKLVFTGKRHLRATLISAVEELQTWLNKYVAAASAEAVERFGCFLRLMSYFVHLRIENVSLILEREMMGSFVSHQSKEFFIAHSIRGTH
ncbi:MAG: hypothetical protein JWL59_4877 [Chthoniobacteraceae bacterium]|nr:hypothetical protein [Chthoniobacteraceae bacterium]